MKLIILLLLVTSALADIVSVELMVPLKKLTAYDCKTDGHSIIVKESSYDGIPIDHGETIFDFHVPEGTVWEDIKYRVNMQTLYITLPVQYPHIYTVVSINEHSVIV